MQREVAFRSIEPQDFAAIKVLHEDLFPVKYSDSFFSAVVSGQCVRGGIQLFTSLAVQKSASGSEAIVGFIIAQTMTTSACEDANDLFEVGSSPPLVCYILTLGLRRDLRRSGLGSILLEQCIQFSSQISDCGAIYLHVISYNVPGRRFYEKNSFLHTKHNPDFYSIHHHRYSSETFALYLHDSQPPIRVRLYEFLSTQSSYLWDTLRWVELSLFGWLSSSRSDGSGVISTSSSAERETEGGGGDQDFPYMDDIVLPGEVETVAEGVGRGTAERKKPRRPLVVEQQDEDRAEGGEKEEKSCGSRRIDKSDNLSNI